MTAGGGDPRALVEAWVREVAALGPDAEVSVEERPCSLPGWPPFEVVLSVGSGVQRHERRVYKRLERVTRLDVAGAWRAGDACCGT